MSRPPLIAVLLALVGPVIGCGPRDAAGTTRSDTGVLAEREARLERAMGELDTVVGRGTAGDSLLASRDTHSGSPDARSREARAAGAVPADSTPLPATENTATRDGGDTAVRDTGEHRLPDAVAIARWILPRDLDEISGMTLTTDGRLLAVGDERGQVSEIDYRRGVLTKQFVVGRPTIEDDLEGITTVRDMVFMLASNGTLYEFREGANGERVDYSTHDTRLGKECEFEGLAYDSTLNALLLACKNVGIKKYKDSLLIYRWSLRATGDRLSHLAVPLDRILAAIDEKKLHPSAITIDPASGNYLLLASIEKAILEITPKGDVVFARKLASEHDQPESIALTPDGILIIGDEATHRPAVVTLYRWR